MRYPMTKYARMYIAELSSVKFANELRFQNIKQIFVETEPIHSHEQWNEAKNS